MKMRMMYPLYSLQTVFPGSPSPFPQRLDWRGRKSEGALPSFTAPGICRRKIFFTFQIIFLHNLTCTQSNPSLEVNAIAAS